MLSPLNIAIFGKVESVVKAAKQQMTKAKGVEKGACQARPSQDNLPA